MKNSRARALGEIHGAVFLFALAGLFGKWVALPSSLIVFGRTFFAFFFLLFLLPFSKQSFTFRGWKEGAGAFLLGLLLAVHWVAFFQSIKESTVAVGLLSYSSFPVFVVFLEPLFFKEKFQFSYLFLGLLTLLGVFLIVPRLRLSEPVTRGVLWGVFAGLSFAVLSVLNKKFRIRRSSLFIALYQNGFAALVLVPFVYLLPWKFRAGDLGLLLVLGVFCTAVAHALFIKGIKHQKAQTASIIASLEPVYGILLALVLLGEIPAARTLLGGALILVATVWVTAKGTKEEKTLLPPC